MVYRDDFGNISGTIGFALDITEHKRAEEAIRESQERLAAAVDAARLGMWDWNMVTGKIIWSGYHEKLFGFSEGEFDGRYETFEKRIHPDDIEGLQEAINQSLKERTGYFHEHRVVWADGTVRWIAGRGRFLYDEKGKTIRMLGIVADITERKHAEEKLMDYQAQLKSLASQLTLAEERERHRIARELHDRISQTLVICKLELDRLTVSTSPKDFQQTLDEVRNSLGKAIADTRSLTFDLSFPLLYEAGFEAAVSAWLSEQIEKKYGIATEFQDDKETKPLDDDVRVLLFRSVRELLINVVKHSQAKKATVSVRRIGREVQVSAEDNGKGFAPKGIIAKAVKTGGFGLFSIKERLEGLGGHLEIESEPGKGTKVTLIAPLRQEDIDNKG